MRPQGLSCTGACTLRASYGCEILQTSVEMHKRCCRRLFLQCFGQKTSRKVSFSTKSICANRRAPAYSDRFRAPHGLPPLLRINTCLRAKRHGDDLFMEQRASLKPQIGCAVDLQSPVIEYTDGGVLALRDCVVNSYNTYCTPKSLLEEHHVHRKSIVRCPRNVNITQSAWWARHY